MELHAEPKLAAQERMVDDASGEVQVPKIHTNTLQRWWVCRLPLFYLIMIIVVLLTIYLGLAYRALGASGSTTQYLWAVLWRRLLSSALYLQQSQQTAVHPLHVAGEHPSTGI